MSNLCLSQMIIDDSDLENNFKTKCPKFNNNSSPAKIEISKRNINESIDDNIRNLFPYLNEEVYFNHYFKY